MKILRLLTLGFIILSFNNASAQFPENSFYIGAGFGQTFQSGRFTQSLNAGGNSQVQESILNYPGFISRFIEEYDGEPVEVLGPADLNNSVGLNLSAQLGYSINDQLLIGFGISTFRSVIDANLQMIYEPFSSNNLQSLDGDMEVQVRTTNYRIFAEYYRKGVWQPFISLGLLLNMQNQSDYDFKIGEVIANTESGGAKYTHFGVGAAIGISRMLLSRHQINLSISSNTYKSEVTGVVEFDPALTLGYRFFLKGSNNK